jgi:flagellar hook-associated protein 1 FlgK
MAVTGNPLYVGITGLLTSQRNIAVTSHNVSNVNTEGYSRQRTDILTNQPTYSGNGYIGTGNSVVNVNRMYDSFLQKQVVSNTGSSEYYNVYNNYASQLDNFLADEKAGLTPAIQDFFSANQGVASDPTSIPAREVLLNQAQNMVDRFHILNSRMNDLRDNVNTEISNVIPEINSIAQELAGLNESISSSPGRVNGILPNDLLDRRDQLIKDLSKFVSVQTIEQDNGAVNVFIGNGQALVSGFNSNTLNVKANEYDTSQLEVGYTVGNTVTNISNMINGGRLGALLDIRQNVIDPIQNSLGRMAVSLTDTYNTQHHLGMDLNGNLGLDVFSVGAPDVLPSSNNTGADTITATVTDPNQLSDSNYILSYDGANYTLARASDNTVVAGPGAMPFVAVDGMDITNVGGANAGDTWLIRPTRPGGRTMDLLTTTKERIAAAAPVHGTSDLTNVGNGSLELKNVTDTTGAEFTTTPGILTPPLMIRFDPTWTPAAGYPINYQVYDNTIPGAPVAIGAPGAYDPTTSPATGADVIATAGLPYGFEFTIQGEPGPGDQFYVDYNTNGTGDNFNMLQLSGLQSNRNMLNSSATVMEAYGSMVGSVGTKAHQSGIAMDAHKTLLDQAVASRDAVSGVNLDEEAANMLKYQQAYQAASQVIVSANKMFDVLLSATRG